MLRPFRTAVALLSLFALTGGANAEVLVFKGNRSVATFGAANTMVGTYVVFDLSANRMQVIDFNSSRSNKDKAQFIQPSTPFTAGDVAMAKARTGLVLLAGMRNVWQQEGESNGSVLDFTGSNKVALTAKDGVSGEVSFAKSLTVQSVNTTINNGKATRVATRGTLQLQSSVTLRENSAKHDLNEAVDAISADLEAKGYKRPIL